MHTHKHHHPLTRRRPQPSTGTKARYQKLLLQWIDKALIPSGPEPLGLSPSAVEDVRLPSATTYETTFEATLETTWKPPPLRPQLELLTKTRRRLSPRTALLRYRLSPSVSKLTSRRIDFFQEQERGRRSIASSFWIAFTSTRLGVWLMASAFDLQMKIGRWASII